MGASYGEVGDARFVVQGIFLSYRREDAAPSALLLQHLLRERFPHAQVFLDLDSIDGVCRLPRSSQTR